VLAGAFKCRQAGEELAAQARAVAPLSCALVCFRGLLENSVVSANLNLASQPFRNRALPWSIAGVIAVASLLVLVLLISESSKTNRRTAEVERETEAQRQEVAALERRIDEIKQSLTPEQQETLKAAQALVERKRFSWARLFADLEAALPGSVRVKRITVRDVALQGERTVAELELVVVSKNAADATAMIMEMDRGGIFRAELIEQNLQKERGESGTESTLRVLYLPRAVYPASGPASSVAEVR
jgi:Tfp pilus assembly protein PilN